MAKKSNQAEGQYVRKETLYMVSLLCLAVGFFGGVVFGVFNSETPLPGQSAGPVQSAPPPQSNIDLSANISMLENAVVANPDNLNAWIELGNNYFDTDQYDKAIQAYRKALDLDPDNANVWTDMGVMYRRSGKPQEAINAFDRAIAVDPKHETSRFNKGIVLMHDLQDFPGAIKAWEGLLQINPIAMAPNGQSVDQMVVSLKQQAAQ